MLSVARRLHEARWPSNPLRSSWIAAWCREGRSVAERRLGAPVRLKAREQGRASLSASPWSSAMPVARGHPVVQRSAAALRLHRMA